MRYGTLPGLAGHQPVASSEQGDVYLLHEWAQMSDPQRVAWMRANLVDAFKQDPKLAWFAADICRAAGAPTRDGPAQLAALLRWVQESIYYVNEDGERLQSPVRTLQARSGDCDDCAALTCALAESIGYQSRFVLYGKTSTGRVVRWSEGQPAPPRSVVFEHIYCELGWPALSPRQWASAEPTIKGAPLGYDVARHGVNLDRDGRVVGLGTFGQSGVWRAPAGQTMALAGFGSEGGNGPAEPGLLQTVFSPSYLRQLSLAVVEGVAVAVATWAMINWVQKGRGRR